MSGILPICFWPGRLTIRRGILAGGAIIAVFALAACHHSVSADTQPLDHSGMAYDSVKELKTLNVTNPEIAHILKIYSAGFPDEDCVEIVRIFHSRGQVFTAGDAVADLLQAGMRDDTILTLATLNQLGAYAGEFEAMHLAGLSDPIILEVARRRSEGKPVLSGASLAGLKNTGLRSSTLLALARRGVPDADAKVIISLRRRGASDAQILRHFSGS
jgi:hypothetical protein